MKWLRGSRTLLKVFGDAFPSSTDLIFEACGKANLDGNSQLVHIGCGPGSVSSLIHSRYDCAISACEILPDMVTNATASWGTDRLIFEVGGVPRVPFPDAWGTHLLAEFRCSPLIDPVPAFAEFKRLLSDDGTLMLTELVIEDTSKLSPPLRKAMASLAPGLNLRSMSDWTALLTTAGFEVRDSWIDKETQRQNGRKLRMAARGALLLRKTGRLKMADYGLGELEEQFDQLAIDAITAIEDGTIQIGVFLAQRT